MKGLPAGLLSLVVVLAAARGYAGEEPAAAAGDFKNARNYVDAHNAVRATVQKPANYAGAWEPIPLVSWSDEIALGAQEWADHLRENDCKLVHSDVRLGENLAGGKGMDPPHAVQLWASEGSKYHYSPIYEFDRFTGHYTQLIWRKTTQIGCGRASCGGRVAIVCRYNPPGNHIDKAPY